MADDDKKTDDPGKGSPELPDDPEELKRLLAEDRKKLGQLLNENKQAKSARDKLTERMKTWLKLEEDGHTPDEIKAILDQKNEEDLSKARDKGEIDKLLENQRKTFDKERNALKEAIKSEQDLNNKVLLDNVLMTELAKVCDPELLEAVFAYYRPKIQMIEDPEVEYGRRSVAVVGGEHMNVPDYVDYLAKNDEKFARFLKPSLAGGGGAIGGAGGMRRQLYRSQMSAKEISQFIRTHPQGPQQGMLEFRKLPFSPEKKAS